VITPADAFPVWHWWQTAAVVLLPFLVMRLWMARDERIAKDCDCRQRPPVYPALGANGEPYACPKCGTVWTATFTPEAP
jgi:hypothetical protein